MTSTLNFTPTVSPFFINRENHEIRESFDHANHSPLQWITTIWTLVTKAVHYKQCNVGFATFIVHQHSPLFLTQKTGSIIRHHSATSISDFFQWAIIGLLISVYSSKSTTILTARTFTLRMDCQNGRVKRAQAENFDYSCRVHECYAWYPLLSNFSGHACGPGCQK